MKAPLDAPVRSLGVEELPDCLDLAADRGWQAEEHKWRLLFGIGEVHGVSAPDGGLAGAVVTTRYGREVTAIGMMLVAGRFARQGLGLRLITHALEHAGTASAHLTATDGGRPLYERVGFRTIGACTQYVGGFRPALVPPRSRPATSADLPAIRALDAEAFGAARTALLDRLPSFGSQLRVVDGPDGITGYGGAWRNVDNTVLGPVIAADDDTAVALLTDLGLAAAGPVRLDLEHRRPALLAWAAGCGLRPGDTTAVMLRGEPLPGDRERLYTPVMVALG
ncbi:GNAT family N-acetyltransferase [Actinosynnema sp. NPDC020468]|uniref:GNAT family N-acetyltransferase n=1 Tax=Actinosynnema sp. NPDC020468 TaxID=3154488 RepID=UPI0033E106D8